MPLENDCSTSSEETEVERLLFDGFLLFLDRGEENVPLNGLLIGGFPSSLDGGSLTLIVLFLKEWN